jgi:hypothetical protein
MATFPVLKTSAVAQYPAKRELRFQNQTLRFLDGKEQRYRDSAGKLHRWEIRLDRLDEFEAAAVEQFFAANEGAFEEFTFTDPWDGEVYEHCTLEGDVLEMTAIGEMRVSISLSVVENRG